MNEKVADILEKTKRLTAAERAALIDALLDEEGGEYDGFATPEIAKAWEEEIKRRIDALDRGEMDVIDAREVTFRSLLK